VARFMIRNKAANKFEVLRITFVLCSSLREMTSQAHHSGRRDDDKQLDKQLA
jgi:hypothetical protein